MACQCVQALLETSGARGETHLPHRRMKFLKIAALALALILVAVALVVVSRTNHAAINNGGPAKRFLDPRSFHEASIVGFELQSPSSGATIVHTAEPLSLSKLQEDLCRPKITISEQNVRGEMIKLRYKITFHDGLSLSNEAELNLFADRAYLRVNFDDDESWIDPAITYRHDVSDRYIRLEEQLYQSICDGLASQSMNAHSAKYWRDAESEAGARLNSNIGNP